MIHLRNIVFSSLVLSILQCSNAFGLGAYIDVSSVQFVAQGTDYGGPLRPGREGQSALADRDYIFISYQINGHMRRLWDDDGLATLYLYHRFIAAQVQEGRLTVESPLAQPLNPLLKALDMLEKTYRGLGPQYLIEVERIQQVRRRLASARKVGDLRESGLEALINDFLSNHTYQVERVNDTPVRNTIDRLVAAGSPTSLTDAMVVRCRDTIRRLNWPNVTSGFEGATGNSPRQGSGQKTSG